MNKMFRTTSVVVVVFTALAMSAYAQKPRPAPAYKIAAIKIVPFNEQIGKFEDEITSKSDRSFFNDLSISLFVTVEVSGEVGSFESGRNLVIMVTEGKKVKYSKTQQIGLIGPEGNYHIPVFLYSSMCSNVTITAKISGQKTVSSMTRRVPFLCGE